jgi:hypothetical protein
MTNVDVNEQVRRRDFIRDMKAASAQGQELDEYRAKREQAADEWAGWFREAMDRHRAEDRSKCCRSPWRSCRSGPSPRRERRRERQRRTK